VLVANEGVVIFVLAIVLLSLGVFFTYIERRVTSVWERIADGFAILRTPKRYLTTVAAVQLAGWGCRWAAMFWFLEAFRIPASPIDALLALTAGSAATLMPLTPGGVGPQQALLLFMFDGVAARSTVLSFSVGMQFAITLTYVILGGIAITLTLRRLPWKASVPKPPEPEPAPRPH
jgi:uncharacterized membrane protein YbhN (UPF0104 family)